MHRHHLLVFCNHPNHLIFQQESSVSVVVLAPSAVPLGALCAPWWGWEGRLQVRPHQLSRHPPVLEAVARWCCMESYAERRTLHCGSSMQCPRRHSTTIPPHTLHSTTTITAPYLVSVNHCFYLDKWSAFKMCWLVSLTLLFALPYHTLSHHYIYLSPKSQKPRVVLSWVLDNSFIVQK